MTKQYKATENLEQTEIKKKVDKSKEKQTSFTPSFKSIFPPYNNCCTFIYANVKRVVMVLK